MKLLQQQTKNGQIFPFPRENEVMLETPPTFAFLREPPALGCDGSDEQVYCIEVRSEDPDTNGQIIWSASTSTNYITPDIWLFPGHYAWNLKRINSPKAVAAGADPVDERGWIHFSIAENAVEFLRPCARDIYDSVPAGHPRHLFFQSDISALQADHPEALDTLRRNVEVAYQDGIPVAPDFDVNPEGVPYREYFGRYRDFCDRNMVACALAYHLLNDQKAGQHAKRLFLTICSWDSEGICSLESHMGDEIGLSNARCFPAVFDLLYPLLSKEERSLAAQKVALYAYQCERRLNNLDFCQNPGNSHAGRLPAYLGEAALVLKGEDVAGIVSDDILQRWLRKAIEIYSGIFPYFGGPDGGWAEGVFYATSYTKWYLPFFSAVRRFSGVDFLKRPFYQRLIDYYQHFCPPGWEIHPFGDGYWCTPDDPEWPGFFAQDPYGIYAKRFGSDLTRAWAHDAQKQEIFKLHLLDIFLPTSLSSFLSDSFTDSGEASTSLSRGVTKACSFPDAGYLSLHTDPEHPASELALLARSSRFGSISHSHADQGSFSLMAGGTALISPSGYFGRAYGTAHHFDWTNQSIAHNTLLIDGLGQASFSYEATGKVLYAKEEPISSGNLTSKLLSGAVDASAAYPDVQKWIRRFELTDSQLTVIDHVELSHPAAITYLLHTLSEPVVSGNDFSLDRHGWHLEVTPLEGDLHDLTATDKFGTDLNEGVPEAYQVTAPKQYHLNWKTPVRDVHDIKVVYQVSRK